MSVSSSHRATKITVNYDIIEEKTRVLFDDDHILLSANKITHSHLFLLSLQPLIPLFCCFVFKSLKSLKQYIIYSDFYMYFNTKGTKGLFWQFAENAVIVSSCEAELTLPQLTGAAADSQMECMHHSLPIQGYLIRYVWNQPFCWNCFG